MVATLLGLTGIWMVSQLIASPVAATSQVAALAFHGIVQRTESPREGDRLVRSIARRAQRQGRLVARGAEWDLDAGSESVWLREVLQVAVGGP